MEKHKRYRKPEDVERETYNKRVDDLIQETNWEETINPIEKWTEIIKQAAEDNLTEIPPKQKQPYISDKAWKLMEKREKEAEKVDWEEARKTNIEIKKQLIRVRLQVRFANRYNEDFKMKIVSCAI